MWNDRLDEAQAGINIAGRNINKLRLADDTTFIAESKEELKSLWMKMKVSEKVGFIFGGSKITADGDCSHEIKRLFLLGREAMATLDSLDIKKQKHYVANRGPSSQSYGFSSSCGWMWDLD